MLRIRALLVTMFFAASGYALSAEALTLEIARTLALANSRTLASYAAATEIALLDEKQQSYEMIPSLSLSGSLSTSATQEKTLADAFASGVSIGASHVLWNGGKNSILQAINSLDTESSRIQARAAYFSVLDDIDSAWYSMLEANASLAAAESAISAAELSFAIADVRLETGAISIIDHLEAEAALDSARATLSQAKRNAAITKIKVASLAGLDRVDNASGDEIGEYAEIIRKVSLFTEEDIEFFISALRGAADMGNTSIQLARIENKKAAKSVNLASADYFPSFTASMSTGLNNQISTGVTSTSFNVSLGGSISLDWWIKQAAVKSATLTAQQTALAGEESIRILDIDLRAAAYDCVSLARSVISGEKALEYAKKLYEGKLELYRLGSASVSELTEAAALMNANEVQLITARYGFLESLSSLRTVSGLDTELAVLEIMP